MANVRNQGTAIGRLTKDIAAFKNADGSRKMMVTLAVQNNYKDSEGKTTSEFISLEGFVPKDKEDGVYALMHEGDLVGIGYSVKTNNYTDKDGNPQYGQVLRINDIELLETKATTDARAAKKAAGDVPAGVAEAAAPQA